MPSIPWLAPRPGSGSAAWLPMPGCPLPLSQLLQGGNHGAGILEQDCSPSLLSPKTSVQLLPSWTLGWLLLVPMRPLLIAVI